MNATLTSAERLLAQMSRAEKAQVAAWVLSDLGGSWPGIEAEPDICGGDACLARTRIPVWVLVSLRRHGSSEADILRAYPTLTAQDLANAWGYWRSHPDEIDRAVRENEAA